MSSELQAWSLSLLLSTADRIKKNVLTSQDSSLPHLCTIAHVHVRYYVLWNAWMLSTVFYQQWKPKRKNAYSTAFPDVTRVCILSQNVHTYAFMELFIHIYTTYNTQVCKAHIYVPCLPWCLGADVSCDTSYKKTGLVQTEKYYLKSLLFCDV